MAIKGETSGPKIGGNRSKTTNPLLGSAELRDASYDEKIDLVEHVFDSCAAAHSDGANTCAKCPKNRELCMKIFVLMTNKYWRSRK